MMSAFDRNHTVAESQPLGIKRQAGDDVRCFGCEPAGQARLEATGIPNHSHISEPRAKLYRALRDMAETLATNGRYLGIGARESSEREVGEKPDCVETPTTRVR